MNAAEKVVCVTGASGYIASWLVKLLLQRGYTVRATVRDPNDPKKTQHLVSLDGAKERLHLFKAELLEEGCFDSVVDGCRGVFHTASPVIISSTDPQNGKPLTPDVVLNETWFSDPRFCEENKYWYMLSKTLAEEAAWRFAKDNRIDLVVLNPGFVIGPLLQPVLNTTSESIIYLTGGERSFPISTYRFVDVRDVANAHIQAFEVHSANGRHCLVERNVQFQEVLKTLNELYPALGLQEKCKDRDKPVERVFQISNEKAKSLGASFIPWNDLGRFGFGASRSCGLDESDQSGRQGESVPPWGESVPSEHSGNLGAKPFRGESVPPMGGIGSL
ncbi:NAD(P)-binding Rossmann-fold superfamily protein [Hibiscus syriacus]|uniref:NAD(P)-binding Rossmann-fold superfamily protein n=1 Tax=Hibiscus syriacus TaxID=106335 RepID=A0A6A2WWB9_HIBSY|nr:NAD(P)-binding Rossmann-fold superfamily protein [Hibiscus syriacus]